MTPRLVFRTAAIAEAVTWAALLAGMVAKYVLRIGDAGVAVGGALHGVVFLIYAAVVVLVGVSQRWTPATALLGLASAVVPFASIPFDRSLERRALLDLAWVQPPDASDRIIDRMLRSALRRPALFATVLIAGVAAVAATLLVVGPPGGKS